MILVYCIPIAILVGYLRGGSLRHYIEHPINWSLLPVFAFLIEALLDRLCHWLPLDRSTCLMIAVLVEYALLFAFWFFNRKRPSMRWICAGVALNFLVIAHNGFRMPVSEIVLMKPAFAAIANRIQSGALMEYVIASVDQPLFCLGDIIYIPFIPNGLGSIGDILLAIGLFRLFLEIMGVTRDA